MAKKQNKATASTQEHLDIEDILDDLVLLKTGWIALVLSTTAVNFDLLSEVEQDATIYAYGAFLNSLSFPLQVLVRSKKADITSYFKHLEEAEEKQPNPDLKNQIQNYKDFIQLTVQRKTVLDKKFYLIINFSPLEAGLKGFGKKPAKNKNQVELLGRAKAALSPKKEHIIKQMARLGLTAKQLTNQELIELFYDIYNPAPTGTQRVMLDTQSYTAPLVKPALEVPTQAPTEEKNVEMVQPDKKHADDQLSEKQSAQSTNQPASDPSQPHLVPNLNTKPVSTQTPGTTQQEALKGLKNATSKASDLLNSPTVKPNLGIDKQAKTTQTQSPLGANLSRGENTK